MDYTPLSHARYRVQLKDTLVSNGIAALQCDLMCLVNRVNTVVGEYIPKDVVLDFINRLFVGKVIIVGKDTFCSENLITEVLDRFRVNNGHRFDNGLYRFGREGNVTFAFFYKKD